MVYAVISNCYLFRSVHVYSQSACSKFPPLQPNITNFTSLCTTQYILYHHSTAPHFTRRNYPPKRQLISVEAQLLSLLSMIIFCTNRKKSCKYSTRRYLSGYHILQSISIDKAVWCQSVCSPAHFYRTAQPLYFYSQKFWQHFLFKTNNQLPGGNDSWWEVETTWFVGQTIKYLTYVLQ